MPPKTPICPNCGRVLQVVIGPPSWAPWLCAVCHRGWWPSELHPSVKAAWDPARRHFKHERAAAVAADVDADRLAAGMRGTSVLDDQLPILDVDVLDSLLDDEAIIDPVKTSVDREKKDR